MSLVWFEELIHLLVLFFEFVGGLLIIYGGIVATAKILLLEIAKKSYSYNRIRLELTGKIVFGLEFLIAADILATIISPSQEELIMLAVVVIIRTILGYFLEKEAKEFQIE
ncbi:protein of unknown function DUF1622 [Methanolacinia petrolearia DSM 11571]|uniref:DUF1622 domain-containing protein n=1 Tax=Methanolacinia petrolearia (strain DSM 11571 / OCM 486 / SEBR 4847) TaxID=679926 RepID=E1RJJ3_METP4|nr:DUF1622 domain-containing protein [Methanolacinia petrolearia]ADN36799.1 protein of unknown function DUF1622 [Methanolacinia petrolearia DSM 11571]